VFRVLLVAISVFSLSVVAKSIPEPAGASVAACSELAERRDRLHAEIARLHAETALVEAELVLLCTKRSNQTDVGLPPLLAVPSQSPDGTADQTTGMQQTAPQTAQRVPARRSGKDEIAYAAHCWAQNSTFTDPSCNCLNEAVHAKLGSRPTIRVVIGSWYDPPSLLLGSRSMGWLWDSFLATVPRLGAAVDSFLLKIVIEGRLGWPVHLISDGLLEGIESALNLSGAASVYQALESGEAHIYPEVRRRARATFEKTFDCGLLIVGWRSIDTSCHGSPSF
jgi:hypothetical protein